MGLSYDIGTGRIYQFHIMYAHLLIFVFNNKKSMFMSKLLCIQYFGNLQVIKLNIEILRLKVKILIKPYIYDSRIRSYNHMF